MPSFYVTVLCFGLVTCSSAVVPVPTLLGSVEAVYALLERVLPGSSSHFALSLLNSSACTGPILSCFTIDDAPAGMTAIAGTTASELSGGVGLYLREYCGMTVVSVVLREHRREECPQINHLRHLLLRQGWPRGGGSNVFIPAHWPLVGAPVKRSRVVPWSYAMNVCTHRLSLLSVEWSFGSL